MATAQIFSHIATESRVGASAMAGGELGGAIGLLLGAIAGIWLVFRAEGRWAGTALTSLCVCALLLIGCLGFVAFS